MEKTLEQAVKELNALKRSLGVTHPDNKAPLLEAKEKLEEEVSRLSFEKKLQKLAKIELNELTYNVEDMLIVLEMSVNDNWRIDFIKTNDIIRNTDNGNVCKIMNELRNGLITKLVVKSGNNVYHLN